jgi:hypothetical protein
VTRWSERPAAAPGAARALGAVALVVVLSVLAGCGQQEQRSAQNLCDRYGEVVAQADRVREPDLQQVTAEAVHEWADGVLARLDQFQAVSEGQYDTLISLVRTAINDVKQSAVDNGAAMAISSDALEDTRESLAERLAPLKARLDVQCPTAS